MKKILLTLLAFVMMTGVAMSATLVAQTEKTELWEQITTVNDKTIACYWTQNRKGMASKVSTGLSCVVADPSPTPIVVYKCWDDNHEHPRYEHQDRSIF